MERIGAGLRREISAIVQSPLPARMRELLARLAREDERKPTAHTPPCPTA